MFYQKKYSVIICPDFGTCQTIRWGLWVSKLNGLAGGETRYIVLDEPIFDSYLLYHTASVIFSRPLNESHVGIIRKYAGLKKKYNFDICVELDDLLFSVQGRNTLPPWNIANIDTLEVNRLYREGILGSVDRWIASTKTIAFALVQEFGIDPDKVSVLPNYCHTSAYWDEHRPSRKKKLDVFYTGSASHYMKGNVGDFEGPWIDGITLAMEKGLIKFHAFGEESDVLPRGTIYHEHVFPTLWPSTLSHYAPDAIVCPLKNHLFNKAKTPLKILEAAAVGSVPIASVFPGSPYSGLTPALCAVGKDTTVDDIVDIFDSLRDPVVRKECIKTIRHVVAEKCLVAEMKPGTDYFVKTVFGKYLD